MRVTARSNRDFDGDEDDGEDFDDRGRSVGQWHRFVRHITNESES